MYNENISFPQQYSKNQKQRVMEIRFPQRINKIKNWPATEVEVISWDPVVCRLLLKAKDWRRFDQIKISDSKIFNNNWLYKGRSIDVWYVHIITIIFFLASMRVWLLLMFYLSGCYILCIVQIFLRFIYCRRSDKKIFDTFDIWT